MTVNYDSAPEGRRKGPRQDILPRVRPDDLRRIAEVVPEELRRRRIWVCCDRTPKERRSGRRVSSKAPLCVHGNADSTDPNTWMTFADACAFALADDRVATLGICVQEQQLVVLDLDHVLTFDEHTQGYECHPKARALIDRLPDSYTEVSPGRDGLHLVFAGAVPTTWRKQLRDAFGDGVHLECYQEGRYLTITGDTLGCSELGILDDRDPPAALRELLHVEAQSHESNSEPVDEALTIAALHAIDASLPYEEWIAVGMALYKLLGSADGLAVWDTWSATAPDAYDGELHAHWRSFAADAHRAQRPGFGTLARLADKHSGGPEWRPRPPMLLTKVERVVVEAPENEAPTLYLSGSQLRAWVGQAEFAIANVLPRTGLFQLFGDPGAGKSLVALSLAFAIATDEPTWMGHEVTHSGAVAVLVGEDLVGVAARFVAECQMRGLKPDEVPIAFSTRPTQLLDAQQMQAHGQAIVDQLGCAPVLVIIDTYATNYGAGSEDSTEDASTAMANAAALQREMKTLLGFVHHSSKGNKGTGRGSGVVLAALDAEFRVSQRQGTMDAELAFGTQQTEPFARTGSLVTVTPMKTKNWQRQAAWDAEIVATEIGTLANGRAELAASLVHVPSRIVGDEDMDLLPENTQKQVEHLLTWIDAQTRAGERVSARAAVDHFVNRVGWSGRHKLSSLVEDCVSRLAVLDSTGQARSRCLTVSKRGLTWLEARVL